MGKTSYLVLVLGALLALCGAVAISAGYGIIQVERGWAGVIVANINSFAIEKLAPEFERVRRAGGALILSGFPEWDLPQGFHPRETLRQEEWVCWICVE